MQIKTKYWTMENKEMTNIIIEGINTIFNKFLVNKGFNPEEMTYCDQTLFLEDRIEIEPYLFIRGVQWFGVDKVVTWFECPESGDITHHYELLSDEQFYGHPLCIDGSKLPEIHNI